MLRAMRLVSKRFVAPLLALAVSGCGAKSSLSTGEERESDGSVPPPFDMRVGEDASVDLGRPDLGSDLGSDMFVPTFEAACPAPIESRPGERVEVRAEITGDFEDGSVRWSQIGGPADVTFVPADSPRTSIHPTVTGIYELLFEAVDRRGAVSSCVVRVIATGSLPLVVCPDSQTVRLGQSLELRAQGFDDEGPVALRWDAEGAGMFALTGLAGASVQTFVGFVPGEYRVTVEGVDTDGNVTACTFVVRVIAPPEIDCPGDAFRAPTRQPLTVALDVRDDTRVVEHRWEPVSWPADDVGIEIVRQDGPSLTLIPQRRGRYELRYTAVDTDGLMSSCLVTVIGEPTPPTLTCPMVITTPPLVDVDVLATAEDDGTITRWRWTLTDQPTGSAAGAPAPADAPMTTFRADIVGIYQLTVEAIDDDGDPATCTTEVRAVAEEGLRIEMFWNTGRSDMDLHLLNPMATAWATRGGPNDCHFRNCVPSRGTPPPDWGGPGADDDPRLDIDDTDGFGPENINIDEPVDGTYRIGVHGWAGQGDVTVRIYCGGSTSEPRLTLGPVRLRERELWRVADVDLRGIACTVTPLVDGRGAPQVNRAPDAFTTR